MRGVMWAVGLASSLQAQATPLPGWEWTPYVGVAQHSPVGTHWGVTPDRNHLVLGIHATATVARLQRLELAYAPEVVPLMRVSNTPEYQRARPDVIEITGRGPAYGAGLSPLGLEARVRLTDRVTFFGAGAAGWLWFTRAVPEPEARAFNYTFEFGGGTRILVGEALRLRVGYKFHHLSNLYTAAVNPGVDGNMVYVGLGWYRPARAPRVLPNSPNEAVVKRAQFSRRSDKVSPPRAAISSNTMAGRSGIARPSTVRGGHTVLRALQLRCSRSTQRLASQSRIGCLRGIS